MLYIVLNSQALCNFETATAKVGYRKKMGKKNENFCRETAGFFEEGIEKNC